MGRWSISKRTHHVCVPQEILRPLSGIYEVLAVVISVCSGRIAGALAAARHAGAVEALATAAAAARAHAPAAAAASWTPAHAAATAAEPWCLKPAHAWKIQKGADFSSLHAHSLNSKSGPVVVVTSKPRERRHHWPCSTAGLRAKALSW